MDSVKKIRSFLIRKMSAAQRTTNRRDAFPDPYRRGFIDGLSMVQSYIDKVISKEAESDEEQDLSLRTDHRGS